MTSEGWGLGDFEDQRLAKGGLLSSCAFDSRTLPLMLQDHHIVHETRRNPEAPDARAARPRMRWPDCKVT